MKTMAVARVGSNAGRGHGNNGGDDVVVPSGARRWKARREVGAGGCGVGFSVDYYLQVYPLTTLNPPQRPKLRQNRHPKSPPKIPINFSLCPYGGIVVGIL